MEYSVSKRLNALVVLYKLKKLSKTLHIKNLKGRQKRLSFYKNLRPLFDFGL